MYEVEIKVRADHEAVRNELESAGADSLGTVHQEDTYYDAPSRDFAETDEALRVRNQRSVQDEPVEEEQPASQEITLTYKGPLVDAASKTRKEAQTTVESEDGIRDILEALDYEPTETVHKRRERYALEDCTVTLDSVRGLGEFVEVEVTSDSVGSDDVDAARDSAIAILRRLGLDPDEQIRTSYLEMLLAGDTEHTVTDS
jgi:adenylate cyclase class 2